MEKSVWSVVISICVAPTKAIRNQHSSPKSLIISDWCKHKLSADLVDRKPTDVCKYSKVLWRGRLHTNKQAVSGNEDF